MILQNTYYPFSEWACRYSLPSVPSNSQVPCICDAQGQPVCPSLRTASAVQSLDLTFCWVPLLLSSSRTRLWSGSAASSVACYTNEFPGSILSKQCVRDSVTASCFDGLALVIKGAHTLSPTSPWQAHWRLSAVGANTGTSGVHLTMHCCIVNSKLFRVLINA